MHGQTVQHMLHLLHGAGGKLNRKSHRKLRTDIPSTSLPPATSPVWQQHSLWTATLQRHLVGPRACTCSPGKHLSMVCIFCVEKCCVSICLAIAC